MRVKLVAFFVFIFFVFLIGRIYILSVQSNEHFEILAKKNAIKTEFITPVRGQIKDLKNRPLAINRLGFSLALAPHLKNSELDEEINFIVSLFADQNATKISKNYKKDNSAYNHDFIDVIDFLDYNETIKNFAVLNLRENISIKPTSIRFYPNDDLASHIIGYVGRANTKDIEDEPITKLTGYIGRSGVESFYNEILQGNAGEVKSKVTALNKTIAEIASKKPESSDIKLTIDLELEEFLRDLFKDKAGAVIIMDLKDGAILAAGSYPEFSLNSFVNGISASEWDELINGVNAPFTNKLVNGLYPPGSVIKMAVGMSFLNSGKITPETKFYCSGAIELGGRKFRCWKAGGHGNETLLTAIRDSCDIYFYDGSLEVGIDFMSEYLTKVGFGRKTGVDLPNEFIGTIPNKEWKMQKYNQQWYLGETVNASIGQGYVLTTPMQVAKNTALIATGKELTPHFLKEINDINVPFEAAEILMPTEKNQLEIVREGMFEVANSPIGTAYRVLQGIPFKIAAKTGTAQVVGISQTAMSRIKEADMEYLQRSHSWMTSFGPYEDPQYVVTVLVEHGGGGGKNGPIVREIYNKLLETGYITLPPQQPKENRKNAGKKRS